MIRAFRKIRSNLLLDKKIPHYLIYALGEILLIVLGILIALWINNRQQKRTSHNKEQFYLQELRSDFEQSKRKLENLIIANRQAYEKARILAEYLLLDTIPAQESELSALLFGAFSNEILYSPTQSTLSELLNTGGLQTLTSAELRKHLTSWEPTIRSIHNQELTQQKYREDLVKLFSGNKGSIRTIFDQAGISEKNLNMRSKTEHLSNFGVIRSLEFENQLLSFILTSQLTENTFYIPLAEEIEGILQLLETELE